MPPRKPTTEFEPPLSPDLPLELLEGEHSGLSSRDEWEGERVADVDLAGQDANQVRVARCELQRVALTGAQLHGLELVDVLAIDCELSGAFLHEASLRRVELRNCRMAGVVLSQASLGHVRFVDCKLDGANFRMAQADHVEMNDCSLVEADFYDVVLAKSALVGCDLRGSDFSKASVTGLRLGRSKLDGMRGALSMGGAVVSGDQVLPLAQSLLGDLRIEIQNDER